MAKKLFILLSALFSLACSANEETPAPKPDSERFLSCALKAKAVQAGSFWGGTYFDTSVTSEKIKDLEIKVSLEELKKGKKFNAAAKIKLAEKSILVANQNDEEAMELGYQLNYQRKLRSVSSAASEEVLPLKVVIRYGANNFEKQFTMFSGNKAYVHIDVDEPSQFDFKVTNLFMICSLD
jgi:hypothetical protein